MSKQYFNASIRVVKSLVESNHMFNSVQVVYLPLIEADNKDEVKKILVSEYPKIFQNDKIYERETKDTAQFFYVIINKLSGYDIEKLNSGSWVCSNCGEVHDNQYLSRPRITYKFGDTKMFCNNDEKCYNGYKEKLMSKSDFPDDFNYINKNSKNYIYKITEKSSGKCYVGKTKNAPFFRWWNHLTHSKSPFGIYLRETSLCDWKFEIIEILPETASESAVFAKETYWIKYFESTNPEKGFNKTISSISNP